MKERKMISGFDSNELNAPVINAIRNGLRAQLTEMGWSEEEIYEALDQLSDDDLLNNTEFEFSKENKE